MTCLSVIALLGSAGATSHRDAPAITADPYADNTDVYAFLAGSEGDEELVILANYMPLLVPGSGPNFWRFADDVAYGCHLDNDGDANIDVSYYFDFDTAFTNPESFLYNVGGIDAPNGTNQQHRTTYDVVRLDWEYDSRGRLIRIDHDTIASGLDQRRGTWATPRSPPTRTTTASPTRPLLRYGTRAGSSPAPGASTSTSIWTRRSICCPTTPMP